MWWFPKKRCNNKNEIGPNGAMGIIPDTMYCIRQACLQPVLMLLPPLYLQLSTMILMKWCYNQSKNETKPGCKKMVTLATLPRLHTYLLYAKAGLCIYLDESSQYLFKEVESELFDHAL